MQSTTAPMGHNAEKAMRHLVMYKGNKFVLVGITAAGNARLEDLNGCKIKGNPRLDKLVYLDNPTVPTSGATTAGNTGKEKAMHNKASNVSAVTTAPAPAAATFAEHLSARRLVSPLVCVVPSLSTALVWEGEPYNHPEILEGLPHLFSWGDVSLYGDSNLLRELVRNIRLGANIGKSSKMVTADSVRKYVGSMFACAETSIHEMQLNIVSAADLDKHLEAMGLPKTWSFAKSIDGEFIITQSAATRIGWKGKAVRRILQRYLTKGKGRVVPDGTLPPGIDVLTCEEKGEMESGEAMKGKVLAWQPGFGLAETKGHTQTSTQAQAMVLGKAMLSKEHLELTGEYFQHLVDRLPAILRGEETRLATSDDPRGQALKGGFNKVGLSVLASSTFAKGVAGTVTKNTDPMSLAIRPVTRRGSMAWKFYADTDLSRTIAACWLEFDPANMPEKIRRAAEVAMSLPVTDKNGLPIIRTNNFPEWAKENNFPSLMALYRSPAGPTSGVIGTVEPLPAELMIFDQGDPSSCMMIFGDSPEFWALVDTPSETGDRDDAYRGDRGEAADLARRGLAWKAKYKEKLDSPAVLDMVEKLNAAVDKKMADVQAAPNWEMPKAATIYGTVFNILRDKETKKPIGLTSKVAPQEEPLKAPSNIAEEIELWQQIWGGDKSPFESAIGSVANAQKWAMLLAIGVVELPAKLAHLKDAIVRILAYEVILSDVIDAAGKGREYEAAHNAVQRMNKTMLWLALFLYDRRGQADGMISMSPVALNTSGDAMKALLASPLSTYGTGKFIDGSEIRAARRDKDGNVITAVSHGSIGFPLLDAHISFHKKVAALIEKEAAKTWNENVQGAVAIALHDYLNRPRVEEMMGESIVKWVGKAYGEYIVKSGLERESRTRFAAFGNWKRAMVRTPKAIAEKLAWVRQPMLKGLEAIRQAAITRAEETGRNPDSVVLNVMLAYSYKFGFTDLKESSLEISSNDLGDFEVKGGLPSVALSTGREGVIEPGDALATFLAIPSTANKVAAVLQGNGTTGEIYVAIGSTGRKLAKLQYLNGAPIDIPTWHGAPAFDINAQIGRSLLDVLAMPGLQLAGAESGHPSQDPSVARIADITAQKWELMRNRIKAKAQEGKMAPEERTALLAGTVAMTGYDRIVAADMVSLLTSRIEGNVIAAELVEGPAKPDATYANTFLKLSFKADEKVEANEEAYEIEEDDFEFEYADSADISDIDEGLDFTEFED